MLKINRMSTAIQLIVLVIGVINLGLIFFIEKLSTVFELTLALYSVAGGAVFGLFTTGMLCPRINTKVNIIITLEPRIGKKYDFNFRVLFVVQLLL